MGAASVGSPGSSRQGKAGKVACHRHDSDSGTQHVRAQPPQFPPLHLSFPSLSPHLLPRLHLLLHHPPGTTGDPKGVMLTHTAVVASVITARSYCSNNGVDLNQHDRLLSYLPLAHIFDRCEGGDWGEMGKEDGLGVGGTRCRTCRWRTSLTGAERGYVDTSPN